MAMLARLTKCHPGFWASFARTLPRVTLEVPKRHSNSQHRVILIPEIPSERGDTNPILRKYDSSTFPEFSNISHSDAFYGLGRALLEFEAAVGEMERKCEEGVTDFKTLFLPIEKARCQFDNVWNSVNVMGIVTDTLDSDRFATLHKRSERALLSRHNSRTIHKTLQAMMAEHEEKNTLTKEEERILERYLLEYRHQGYELNQAKFDELNTNWMKRLHDKKNQYNYRMMVNSERFRHTITNPNIVQDFPVDVLRAMGSDSSQPSKGPWTVTLHPYIFSQFMSHCSDRHLRFNAHFAKVSQGSKNQDVYTSTVSLVKEIRQYRLDQAVTLGYSNYAQMSMDTKMATNVENVHTMIASLLGKAKQKQEIELETLQEYAESRGFEEQLEVYDIAYFKRKQRRTILGVSDEDLRNFFPLPRVLSGIFHLCQNLFNVHFEEVKTPEVRSSLWHKDVNVYRIIDGKSGKPLGHFYFDPYIRDDKGYAGGNKGWYVPMRPHSVVAGSTPLGAMILSLPAPNYGKPSLLNFYETEELLKHFGNMLIHILASSSWSDLSGKTGVEWDVLDLPGKFMTHWLYHPDVLNLLTGHWSTNESLNPDLVDKLCNVAVKQHLAGYTLCEELFKAAYDIAFYTEDYDNESYVDIATRLQPQYLLLPKIKGDEFPMYFQEMIGGDYPAGIFCSTWANMLAADAFSAVQEATTTTTTTKVKEENDKKIYEQEEVIKVTNRFRSTFLSLGSSLPSAETFRKFRGRDPSHEALLLSLGLKSTQPPKKKGPIEES